MKMITLLGPTATGKTRLAALLASRMDGEIISADSRQVYKRMNLGTGKDYDDYTVNGKMVPFHLVDIAEPGYEYSVYEFQHDFHAAYQNIVSREKLPILCGGTGMYLESVLRGYQLYNVPENIVLRDELSDKTDEELCNLLASMRPLHATTDTVSRERLLRAIEIEIYHRQHPEIPTFPAVPSLVFGINCPRETVRQRITQRLKQRLQNGMTEEVRQLLEEGIPPQRLKAYGLEYKFITQYLLGELSYDEMFRLLNTAIHQFAKRQMTWFRRMERNGINILWIDGSLGEEEKTEAILRIIND